MILFYLIAVLTIASAITVVLHRNPVYSALALVNTLFLIAAMFVLLDAHMIAFLQVIVYAGAIMVLFLFVIMLLSPGAEEPLEGRSGVRNVAVVTVLLLAAELGTLVIVRAAETASAPAPPAGFGSTEGVARELFSTHVLPFEVTSLLLLVAVFGAVVMARRKV